MTNVQQAWNAQDYAANSSVQYGWGSDLIDRLTLRGDERILDIGCGDGRLTARLAGRVPRGQVVGIDASAAMVALAGQRWGEADRLTFRQMDAQAIRFAADLGGRFDVVFSSSALHWLPDHPAMLAGVRHSLRGGGRLWMQTGGSGNCAAFLAAVDRVCASPHWRGYFADFRFPWQFCTAEAYARWLPQAGLRVGAIEKLRRVVHHDGREALAGWIRTTWLPYLARVPTGEQAAFVDAAVASYLMDMPADAAGRIPVAMVRLEVMATPAASA